MTIVVDGASSEFIQNYNYFWCAARLCSGSITFFSIKIISTMLLRLTFHVTLCCMLMISCCICSSLFRNSHNLEIALRILSIAKLRTNFEIACPPVQFGNEALYFSFVCINCCVSCYIICTLCNVVVINFYHKQDECTMSKMTELLLQLEWQDFFYQGDYSRLENTPLYAR